MKLSKEEVEHVAWLARLELADEEKSRLTSQLNELMVHFEKLQQLDTTEVAPTSHSIPVSNVFREDAVGPCLPVEDAVSNAPETRDGYFVVPQVVEI
ncbi:MAG TPA: Asp-tRNA(Asn)/Glu-tRNA(Gln) amidotransferase subunit GatC [Armatimonadota bacterium]|nr:Asp-tRNA(Asn)/Glu-tRNA(Gln) amidotransferase subunit GatC [Armatimonadota bacterium]